MRPPIDGGTVLVTGASSGIGEALAIELAPRAARLVLVARRVDRLEQLATRLREERPSLEVVVKGCDLVDRTAVNRLLGELEGAGIAIDVLINNAGFGDVGMFDLADWAKLERMIVLNVTALTYLTHRLVRPMIERRRGGILQVSSGFGLTFLPGFATYVGTKHYVTGFTESLRIELAEHGIAVTQLCPGPVATEFEDRASDFDAPGVPGLLQISAERCAREAIRGFDRGRAIVVPGRLMGLVVWSGVWSPRWIQRLLFSFGSRRFRRMQLAAASKAGS